MSDGNAWVRRAGEGVVIVVSILLAFSVDAAWEDFQEKKGERDALRGLALDFATNRADLREAIDLLAQNNSRFDALEALSSQDMERLPEGLCSSVRDVLTQHPDVPGAELNAREPRSVRDSGSTY